MASISKEKSGWRIQFSDASGKRKTMRLGKCSKSDANTIRLHLERILSAKRLGSVLPAAEQVWLESDGAAVRDKFVAIGLVDAPEEEKKDRPTLRDFLADFIERNKAGKKPGTIAVWNQVVANLNEIMPRGILLDEVTTGHAKDFHSRIKQRMATSTVDKRIRFCRQFFTDAVDWKLIDSNPFKTVKTQKAAGVVNVHVEREVVERILSRCNPTWRTIVALCRYGGLRCPSEVLSLKWRDVDWSTMKLSITEPKVEHHEGRGVRLCPIFNELQPYLLDAAEIRRDNAEYVIDHGNYRRLANTKEGWKNANLRSQFERVIKQAGVKPWKRLFHSMRASRQTELERDFPLHVVCSWLGNSPRIAKESYLLVTENDFERATQNPTQLPPNLTQNPTHVCDGVEGGYSVKTQQNIGKNAYLKEETQVSKRRGQDSKNPIVLREKRRVA